MDSYKPGSSRGMQTMSGLATGVTSFMQSYQNAQKMQLERQRYNDVKQLEMAKLQMQWQEQMGKTAIDMGQLNLLTNFERAGFEVPGSVKNQVFENMLENAKTPEQLSLANQAVKRMGGRNYMAELGIEQNPYDRPGVIQSTPATIDMAQKINASRAQAEALGTRLNFQDKANQDRLFADAVQREVDRRFREGESEKDRAARAAEREATIGADVAKQDKAIKAAAAIADKKIQAAKDIAAKKATRVGTPSDPELKSLYDQKKMLQGKLADASKGMDGIVNPMGADAIRRQMESVDQAIAAKTAGGAKPIGVIAPSQGAVGAYEPGRAYKAGERFQSKGVTYEVIGTNAAGKPQVKRLP